MMERENTPLQGLLVLRPRIFSDERGAFLETFNQRGFAQVTGDDVEFVQDNESRSALSVLRGLHFQSHPFAQGKLVHVIQGAVLDVCVDIRPESPTYGKHFKKRLDGLTKEMLWIPEGFAHGFVALEHDTLFAYKCTNYYHPASEHTLAWDDPDLNIDWGVSSPLISPKDRVGLAFASLHGVLKS
jgi:dTDP-4-dehydrorhamnose 3,5-epimerase